MHRNRPGLHVRTRGRGIAWVATIVAIAAVAATGACLFNTETTLCETSGLICPPRWRCAAAQDVCIPIGGCGDGIKSPGEVCDDGNVLPGDSCSPDCQSDKPCGDRVVDPGEDCDDGVDGSQGCNSNCTFNRCGDHIVNAVAGEQCDTGGMITPDCDGPLCTVPSCGDSFFNPRAGEACDSGGENTALCDSDCTAPVCGDGIFNEQYTIPGEDRKEQCDEGKTVMGVAVPTDTAACNKDCTKAKCGDKYVNMAAGETCDDGTGLNSDSCPDGENGSCKVARCGDGFVRTISLNPSEIEECDTKGVDTDTCNGGTCKFSTCGDGYLNAADGEMCETGHPCIDTSKNCNGNCQCVTPPP